MSMEQVPNGVEEQELPERWSARRKMEIVLRLLRGEDLGQRRSGGRPRSPSPSPPPLPAGAA